MKYIRIVLGSIWRLVVITENTIFRVADSGLTLLFHKILPLIGRQALPILARLADEIVTVFSNAIEGFFGMRKEKSTMFYDMLPGSYKRRRRD
ncbi:MAG: hypothetical protein ABI254_03750 [Chthoniobacterales bacterium]